MKVQQNADGKRWDVVKGDSIVATFDSIKAAMDARYELSRKPAPKTLYFKADGTEVYRKPRQRVAAQQNGR
jgi:hypothetical protein